MAQRVQQAGGQAVAAGRGASAEARGLIRSHRVIASAVSPLEVQSALYRLRRSDDLTEVGFEAIMGRLRRECEGWLIQEVDEPILRRAENVIERSGLRTLDSIHVASALEFRR